MAISNYAELQTEITDWMARNDVQGKATTFIQLAESRLNRLLEPVSTTATLTGTAGSPAIDISVLNMTEPDALWVTADKTERSMTPLVLGTFPTTDQADVPAFWAIEGNTIQFERPCADAYSFRFIFKGRLALSNAAPSNAFLKNHPDLYLAASIYWGSVYIQNAGLAVGFKSMWDEFLAEVQNEEAEKKRGMLTVDPMLTLLGRRCRSDL
ncbi:hypothetical protein [Shinella zoogloeoides]|uniref:phage adaptor protein n=1 Tax=Shinella zoogloeoides TaxID=352475 RepID=UPI0028AB4B4A|nr:hypothetical protein [Shinella zoogloeoides]